MGNTYTGLIVTRVRALLFDLTITNAELIAKIKAEIERRIADNTFGAKLELIDILAWLDTLESGKPIPADLEEAAEEYTLKHSPYGKNAFIAGAKWQAEQLLKSSPLPEDTILFNKGVEEGKRLVMEEAVEKEVLQVTRKRSPVVVIRLDENKYKDGDKVRVIVLPKEDDR